MHQEGCECTLEKKTPPGERGAITAPRLVAGAFGLLLLLLAATPATTRAARGKNKVGC